MKNPKRSRKRDRKRLHRLENLEARQLLALDILKDANFLEFRSDQDVDFRVVDGRLEYRQAGGSFTADVDLGQAGIQPFDLPIGDEITTIRVVDTNATGTINVGVGRIETKGANLELGFAESSVDSDGDRERGRPRGPKIQITDTIDTAGGDIAFGSVDEVVVLPGVVVSTRTDIADPAAGPAGDLSLSVANDDRFNPFFNVDAVTINVGDGARLLADSTGAEPGDVALTASNVNFSLDSLIFNSISGLDRAASIDVNGAEIVAGNIDINADTGDINLIGDRLKKLDDKEDTDVDETVAGEWAAGLLQSLVFKLDDIISLPATLSVRKSTSDIQLSGTTLVADADVDVEATTKAEAFGEATYFFSSKFGVAVSVMYAEPTANVTLEDTEVIAGRDVSLKSKATGVADGEAKVKQNTKLTKQSTAKESVEFAFAVGVNRPDSDVLFDKDSSIIADGNVSVISEGSNNTKSTATTTSFVDGTAGITFALNYTEADIRTQIDGDITARSREIADVVRFNPLDNGVIDFATNEIRFGSPHGFEDGDDIVYDSGLAAPLEGLESGDSYSIKVVDETTIQLQADDASGDPQVVSFGGAYSLLNVGNRTLPIVSIEDDGVIVFPDSEHQIASGESVSVQSAPGRVIHRRVGDSLIRLDGSQVYTAIVDPGQPDRLALIDDQGEGVELMTDSVFTAGNTSYRLSGFSVDDDNITLETLDGEAVTLPPATAVSFTQGHADRFAGLNDGETYYLVPFAGEDSSYRLTAESDHATRAIQAGNDLVLQVIATLEAEDPQPEQEAIDDAAADAFNNAVVETLIDPDVQLTDSFDSVVIDLTEASEHVSGSGHELRPTGVSGIIISATLSGKEGGKAGGGIGGTPKARNALTGDAGDASFLTKAFSGLFGSNSSTTDPDSPLGQIENSVNQATAESSAEEFSSSRESRIGVAASILIHYSDNSIVTQVGQEATLVSGRDLTIGSSAKINASGSASGSVSFGENKDAKTAVAAALMVGIYNNDVQTLVERGASLNAARNLTVAAKKEYPFKFPFRDPSAFDAESFFAKDPVKQLTALFDGKFGLQSLFVHHTTQTKASASTNVDNAIAASIQYVGYSGVSEAIVGWEEEGSDYAGIVTRINQDLPADMPALEQSVVVDAETLVDTIHLVGNFSIGFTPEGLKKAIKKKDVRKVFSTTPTRGSKLGIGGTADVLELDHTTRALMVGPTVVTTDALKADAFTRTFALRLDQAGSSAGKAAIAGTISVGLGQQTTIAQIDDQVTVNADDVTINAVDDSLIIGYAGGVVTGEAAGFGITVAVNDIDRTTRAIAGRSLDDSASGTPVIWDTDSVSVTASSKGQIAGVSFAAAIVRDKKGSGSGGSSSGGNSGGNGGSGGGSEGGAFRLLSLFSSLSDENSEDGSVDSSKLTEDVTTESGDQAPKPDDEDGKDYETNPRGQAELSPNAESSTADGEGTTEGQGKFGVAISGNVSVNLLTDIVESYIAGSIVIGTATDQADVVTVDAENNTLNITIGGAFAFSVKQDGKNVGIAGAVSYNQLDGKTLAAIYDATLNVHEVHVNSSRDGVSGTFTAGAAGASQDKGIAVSGSVSINRLSADTQSIVEAATIISDESVGLTALDKSQIISIAGAGSFGGKAGVGAAVSYNELGGETAAILGTGSNVMLRDSASLAIQATNEREKKRDPDAKAQPRIVSVTGAVGVSKDAAGVAGMVSVNLMNNETKAAIDGASVMHVSPASLDTNVTVQSLDQSWIVGVGGAVGIGGKAGIGLGIGFNRIRSQTVAEIRDSDLDVGRTLLVDARTNSEIEGVTIGVGGGTKAAIAGSASVNLVQNATLAQIIETDPASDRSIRVLGDAIVTALDESLLITIAGSGAGSSGKFAAGAAIGYNLVGSQELEDEPDLMGTQALLDGVHLVAESGDIELKATSSTLLVGVAAGGSGSSGVAIAGSFSVNETKKTIVAEIRNAELVQTRGGDLIVDAVDRSEMVSFAGAGAGAGTVAIGVAVTANNVQNIIRAGIRGNSSAGNTNIDASGDVLVTAGFRDAESLRMPTELVLTEDDEPIKLPSRDDELKIKRKRRDEDGEVIEEDERNTGSVVAVAVSGSGAGTVAINGSVSLNWSRNEVLAAIADDAIVSAGEDITVSAEDTARLYSIAGGGSGAGTVAVGASLAFNYLGGDPNRPNLQGGNRVRAEIRDATATAQTVDVSAVYSGEAFAFSITGAGAGTVAVVGSINLNFMASTVEAEISEGSVVRSSTVDANSNGVEVIARNDGSLIAFGGAGSGAGTVAIAAAVTSNIISSQVTAAISGSDTQVTTQAGDLRVEAGTNAEILNITIGGSGSGVAAVAGSGVGNVINGNTAARITDATVDASRDLSVRAIDSSIISSVVGAGAGSGVVSGGVSVDVNLFQSTTVAEINGASTNALRETRVEALSEQGLVGVAITGAGALGAAIAGAIGVSSVNTTTIARIGDNASINQDPTFESAIQDVIVRAESKIGGTGKKLLGVNDNDTITRFTTGRGSGAGGIGGVATSIDVVKLRPRTLAEIGDSVSIDAGRDIRVLANSEIDATANTFSFAGGIAALNGTVGVLTVGRGLDADEREQAIGESDDNGDNAETISEKQLRLFDKAIGIESQAATAVGDAFANDVRSEGATVLIGDGSRLSAARNLKLAATTDVTIDAVTGQGTVGILSVGGSVTYLNSGMSANVTIGDSDVSAGGNIDIDAKNTFSVNSVAAAGSAGVVTVAAQSARIRDSSTERIQIADGASLSATNQLRLVAGRDQSFEANATGGQVGGVAAGGAEGVIKVLGGTAVHVGENVRIGGQTIEIGTETDIKTDAVSVAVAVGGITAAAAVSKSEIEPNISTTIGDNAVITGEDVTIATKARFNGVADALGTAIALAATGPSVSKSVVAPRMSTHIGEGVVFDVDQNLLIDTAIHQFDNQTRTVASFSTASSGGGIGISAGTSDALLAGSVTTAIGNDVTVRNAGNVEFRSSTDTDTFAQMLAASGAIIAGGDSEAASINGLVNRVEIAEDLNAIDVGTVYLNANSNNIVAAFDVSGTGGLFSGASARAKTTNLSRTSVDWQDSIRDSQLTLDNLVVNASDSGTIRSAVDSVNASAAGGVGVKITNTVDTRAGVTLPAGLDVDAEGTVLITASNTVRKELPVVLKPKIDKDGDGNFEPDEDAKPIRFDVASGSGGIIDVPSASSETTIVNRAEIVSSANLSGDSVSISATPILDVADRVRLTSGGSGTGVVAKSNVTASPVADIFVGGDVT
ncbi:MAG: hypothetical protein AAFX06_06085 [Planctomycetota bacterium]